MQGYRWLVTPRREIKPGVQGFRGAVGINLRSGGLHPGWVLQTQGPVGDVQDVAAPVAGLARSEVPPEAPVVGRIGGAVGTCPGGSEPEIPLEMFRNRRGALRQARHSSASSYPGVTLTDLADGLFLDELNNPVDVSDRVTLDAELGGDLLFAGKVGHDSYLLNRMSHRFFAVEMLAKLQCRNGGVEVGMVRGADGDRVDVLGHRIEHLAEIVELFRLGKLGVGVPGSAVIDIAESDDVLIAQRVQVGPSASANSDAGDIELLAWKGAEAGRGHTRHPGSKPGHCRVAKHVAAADSLSHIVSPKSLFPRIEFNQMKQVTG